MGYSAFGTGIQHTLSIILMPLKHYILVGVCNIGPRGDFLIHTIGDNHLSSGYQNHKTWISAIIMIMLYQLQLDGQIFHTLLYHPGLAENIAPDGGPGSDIIVVSIAVSCGYDT